jgi:hypothetical protein
VDDDYVVSTVRERHWARAHARDMHRALMQARKSAPGAVGIDQRDSGSRGPRDRDQAVRTGCLEAHERADAFVVQFLQGAAQHSALVAAEDPLVRELRRAYESTRHDERVAR